MRYYHIPSADNELLNSSFHMQIILNTMLRETKIIIVWFFILLKEFKSAFLLQILILDTLSREGSLRLD